MWPRRATAEEKRNQKLIKNLRFHDWTLIAGSIGLLSVTVYGVHVALFVILSLVWFLLGLWAVVSASKLNAAFASER